jgi:predicted DNA-binding protein with PD1-like motif
MGGLLFSETILFAGEIDLQEMTGEPLERVYDDKTGLRLWNLES